eukprot:3756650-Rhodomonas_salina.1
MSQRLAPPQHPGRSQPFCPLITDLVQARAQVQMCQCLACTVTVTQHLSQTTRSLTTNPVLTQVPVSQRLALPQHPRKYPCSLCTDPTAAQVQTSQRLALPQHSRQHTRSLIATRN